MKITKQRLRRIIQEAILAEQSSLSDDEAIQVLEDELDVGDGVINVKEFLNGQEGSDPKVRDFLSQTNDPSEKITVGDDTVKASSLKPTQNEISISNSIGWPLSKMSSLRNIKSGDPTGGFGNDAGDDGNPVPNRVVTADDLVIDGHHRWSQVFAIGGPQNDLLIKNIDLPGDTASEKLAVAQVAIVATMGGSGPVPSAAGSGLSDNVLGQGKGEIKDMILDMVDDKMDSGDPLMGPEWLAEARTDADAQGFFGITEDMQDEDIIEAVADVVAGNLANLPGMAQGAPGRDDMPQFGLSTQEKDVFAKMDSGQVNYKSPFDPRAANEGLDLERWQRLAGILKD